MTPVSTELAGRTNQILEVSGALLRGHFLLSSGLHSDRYCQCARALENPQHASALASMMGQFGARALSCDTVVAPALGGVVWGYALASALGARSIFAERNSDGEFSLRRGFRVSAGERVVIAEDVVTTGGSVMELESLLRGRGAEVVAIAAIVDRSRGSFSPRVPHLCLTELTFQTFEANACPLCREGLEIDRPGSRQ